MTLFEPILVKIPNSSGNLSWTWGYIAFNENDNNFSLKISENFIENNVVPPIPFLEECVSWESNETFLQDLLVYDINGPFNNTTYFLSYNNSHGFYAITHNESSSRWFAFKYNIDYKAWTPTPSSSFINESEKESLRSRYVQAKEEVQGFQAAHPAQWQLWQNKNFKCSIVDSEWLKKRDDDIIDLKDITLKDYEDTYSSMIPIHNYPNLEQRALVAGSGFGWDLQELKKNTASKKNYCDIIQDILEKNNNAEAALLLKYLEVSGIKGLARRGSDTNNPVYEHDERPIEQWPNIADFHNFILTALLAERSRYFSGPDEVQIKFLTEEEAQHLIKYEMPKQPQISDEARLLYYLLNKKELPNHLRCIRFYFKSGLVFSFKEAIEGILKSEERFWSIKSDLEILFDDDAPGRLNRLLTLDKRDLNYEGDFIDISYDTYRKIYLNCFRYDSNNLRYQHNIDNLIDIENTLSLFLKAPTNAEEQKVHNELSQLLLIEFPDKSFNQITQQQLDEIYKLRINFSFVLIIRNPDLKPQAKIEKIKGLIDSFEGLGCVITLFCGSLACEDVHIIAGKSGRKNMQESLSGKILVLTQSEKLIQLGELLNQYPFLYTSKLNSIVACILAKGVQLSFLNSANKAAIQKILANKDLIKLLHRLLDVPIDQRFKFLESYEKIIKDFNVFMAILPLIRNDDEPLLFNLLLNNISKDDSKEKDRLREHFSSFSDEMFSTVLQNLSKERVEEFIDAEFLFVNDKQKRKILFDYLSTNELVVIKENKDLERYFLKLVGEDKKNASIEKIEAFFESFVPPQVFSSLMQTKEKIYAFISFLIDKSITLVDSPEETKSYISTVLNRLPSYAVFILCKPFLKRPSKLDASNLTDINDVFSQQGALILSENYCRKVFNVRSLDLEQHTKYLWIMIKNRALAILKQHGTLGNKVADEITRLEKIKSGYFDFAAAEAESNLIRIFESLITLPKECSPDKIQGVLSDLNYSPSSKQRSSSWGGWSSFYPKKTDSSFKPASSFDEVDNEYQSSYK